MPSAWRYSTTKTPSESCLASECLCSQLSNNNQGVRANGGWCVSAVGAVGGAAVSYKAAVVSDTNCK